MAKSVTQSQLKTMKSEMEPTGIETWTWIVKKILQMEGRLPEDHPTIFLIQYIHINDYKFYRAHYFIIKPSTIHQ